MSEFTPAPPEFVEVLCFDFNQGTNFDDEHYCDGEYTSIGIRTVNVSMIVTHQYCDTHYSVFERDVKFKKFLWWEVPISFLREVKHEVQFHEYRMADRRIIRTEQPIHKILGD